MSENYKHIIRSLDFDQQLKLSAHLYSEFLLSRDARGGVPPRKEYAAWPLKEVPFPTNYTSLSRPKSTEDTIEETFSAFLEHHINQKIHKDGYARDLTQTIPLGPIGDGIIQYLDSQLVESKPHTNRSFDYYGRNTYKNLDLSPAARARCDKLFNVRNVTAEKRKAAKDKSAAAREDLKRKGVVKRGRLSKNASKTEQSTEDNESPPGTP